ncbi:hypothetical protein FSP39_018347 [Pinctada imbricata]|uniref:Cystatin domain-containing protein n=1 Tax=Pinctada imbricata TaxID=66713 RepID=A0AA88Y5L1_PINIB|nr:hypothetical protein FSP39_018347 [Pinctada imbricata]
MMCGGTSDVKSADEEIQSIVNQVKNAAEEKAGKKFDTFVAVQYKSQVVAGTNYFVKVNVGDSHIHLRVFKPLPHTGASAELSDLQKGKTVDDPIEYF